MKTWEMFAFYSAFLVRLFFRAALDALPFAASMWAGAGIVALILGAPGLYWANFGAIAMGGLVLLVSFFGRIGLIASALLEKCREERIKKALLDMDAKEVG